MADPADQGKKFRMWRTPDYAFEFSPPLHSDELFAAMKASYPHLKTHPQRMTQAIIDFGCAEQLEEQRRASPAASQASSSGSSAAFSASSLRSSVSAQSPPSSQASGGAAGDGPVRQTKASPSSAGRVQKSAASKSKMYGMMNTFVVKTGKSARRTPMTAQQLSEYADAREKGACDRHRRRKKKCPPGCPDRIPMPTTSPFSVPGPLVAPVEADRQTQTPPQDAMSLDQLETSPTTAPVMESRQNESLTSPMDVSNNIVSGPQIDGSGSEQIPAMLEGNVVPQPVVLDTSNDLTVMNAAVDYSNVVPFAFSDLNMSNQFEGHVSNSGYNPSDSEMISYSPNSTSRYPRVTHLLSNMSSATSRATDVQVASFLSIPDEYKIQGQLWSPDDDMGELFDFDYMDTTPDSPAVNMQPSAGRKDQGFNSHYQSMSSATTMNRHRLMSQTYQPELASVDPQSLLLPGTGTAHTDLQPSDQRNGQGWDPFVPMQQPHMHSPFEVEKLHTPTTAWSAVARGGKISPMPSGVQLGTQHACTSCNETCKCKADWKRHEDAKHPLSWNCDHESCSKQVSMPKDLRRPRILRQISSILRKNHLKSDLATHHGCSPLHPHESFEEKRKRRRDDRHASERRCRDNINERISDLNKLAPQHARPKEESAGKNAVGITRSTPQIAQPNAVTSGGPFGFGIMGILDVCFKVIEHFKAYENAAKEFSKLQEEIRMFGTALRQLEGILQDTRDTIPQNLLDQFSDICSSGRDELENIHQLILKVHGNKNYPITRFRLERSSNDLRLLRQKVSMLLEPLRLSLVIKDVERSCAAYYTRPGTEKSSSDQSNYTPARGLKIWEAGLATSAAPFYFPQSSAWFNSADYIDGGISRLVPFKDRIPNTPSLTAPDHVRKGLRMLCLDGGGIRGISELDRLRSLFDKGSTNIAPDYFHDLMIGTSRGGLVAIMLGRLHMQMAHTVERIRRMTATPIAHLQIWTERKCDHFSGLHSDISTLHTGFGHGNSLLFGLQMLQCQEFFRRLQHHYILPEIKTLRRGAHVTRDITSNTYLVNYSEHHSHHIITNTARLFKLFLLAFIVALPLGFIGLDYCQIYHGEHTSQTTQPSLWSSYWTQLDTSWQHDSSYHSVLATILLWLIPALVLSSSIPIYCRELRQFQVRSIAFSAIVGISIFSSLQVTSGSLVMAIFTLIIMGTMARSLEELVSVRPLALQPYRVWEEYISLYFSRAQPVIKLSTALTCIARIYLTLSSVLAGTPGFSLLLVGVMALSTSATIIVGLASFDILSDFMNCRRVHGIPMIEQPRKSIESVGIMIVTTLIMQALSLELLGGSILAITIYWSAIMCISPGGCSSLFSTNNSAANNKWIQAVMGSVSVIQDILYLGTWVVSLNLMAMRKDSQMLELLGTAWRGHLNSPTYVGGARLLRLSWT